MKSPSLSREQNADTRPDVDAWEQPKLTPWKGLVKKNSTLPQLRDDGVKIVFGLDISWIALHGCAQMLHRFFERAAFGERSAKMPVRVRGIGIERELTGAARIDHAAPAASRLTMVRISSPRLRAS